MGLFGRFLVQKRPSLKYFCQDCMEQVVNWAKVKEVDEKHENIALWGLALFLLDVDEVGFNYIDERRESCIESDLTVF